MSDRRALYRSNGAWCWETDAGTVPLTAAEVASLGAWAPHLQSAHEAADLAVDLMTRTTDALNHLRTVLAALVAVEPCAETGCTPVLRCLHCDATASTGPVAHEDDCPWLVAHRELARV